MADPFASWLDAIQAEINDAKPNEEGSEVGSAPVLSSPPRCEKKNETPNFTPVCFAW
jgi:hypothetical protein